jgi:hypothetical protein
MSENMVRMVEVTGEKQAEAAEAQNNAMATEQANQSNEQLIQMMPPSYSRVHTFILLVAHSTVR